MRGMVSPLDNARLPDKGSAYSLPEILAYARLSKKRDDASPEQWAEPSEIERAYRGSFRVDMALQRLQSEVAGAVRSANYRPAALFPQDEREYYTALNSVALAKEIRFDPTTEARKVANDAPSWRMKAIREAQSDPLAMARKHVVDLLAPHAATVPKITRAGHAVYDVLMLNDRMSRENAAGDVQQIMMLMADNAVNHQSKYREHAA